MSWQFKDYLHLLIFIFLGIFWKIRQLPVYDRHSKIIDLLFWSIFIINVYFYINSLNQKYILKQELTHLKKETNDLNSRTRNIIPLPSGGVRIIAEKRVDAKDVIIDQKLLEAQKHSKRGDYSLVLKLLSETEKMDHQDPIPQELFIMKANAYYRQNQFGNALVELNKINKENLLKENIQLYYYLLGACYGGKGDYQKSKTILKVAISIDENTNLAENAKKMISLMQQ